LLANISCSKATSALVKIVPLVGINAIILILPRLC
jgi:hypothetical protein